MKKNKEMQQGVASRLPLAFLLMAGTATMFMLQACSENDDLVVAEEAEQPSSYTLVVEANKAESHDTRAIGFDGSGALRSSWASTEKVEVYNKVASAESAQIIATLRPTTTGSKSTTLTGTLSTKPSTYSTLYLYTPSANASYDGQDGLLASISQKYNYAEATVTVQSNTTNLITTTDASFANMQAIVKFILKDKNDNDISVDNLIISDETGNLVVSAKGNSTTKGNITVTPSLATNELYVALRGVSASNLNLVARVGADIYTYSRSGVTFEAGKYYVVTMKMKKMEGTRMWDGGPYWAEDNVPGYYAWDDRNYLTDTRWRLPTKEEYAALMANTTWTNSRSNNSQVNSLLVLTGTGSYSSISISFPGYGYKDEGNRLQSYDSSNNVFTTGHYWSSTEFNESVAYEFAFGSSDANIDQAFKSRKNSIRLVHN